MNGVLTQSDEKEKLVRELPRDTEIVALFERISDGCMIARPDPTIAVQLQPFDSRQLFRSLKREAVRHARASRRGEKNSGSRRRVAGEL
jgi:hypothetical protein